MALKIDPQTARFSPTNDSSSIPREVIDDAMRVLTAVFGCGPKQKPDKAKASNRKASPNSRASDLEHVNRLFEMLLQTGLGPCGDDSDIIMQNLFFFHAFVSKMKDSLISKDFGLAMTYDMIQRLIWNQNKGFLFKKTQALKKSPQDCLVPYCKNPGHPFFRYNDQGELELNVDMKGKEQRDPNLSPPPHFCPMHAIIAWSLQSKNKHNHGRLHTFGLPEIYWDSDSQKIPDHYRTSLSSFWERWSLLILERFQPAPYLSSFQHQGDGALMQADQLRTGFMENQGLKWVLGVKVDGVGKGATSKNISGFSLALIKQNQNDKDDFELVDIADERLLNLMKDHSKYSLKQPLSTPSLLELVAVCTPSSDDILVPYMVSLLNQIEPFDQIFRLAIDQMCPRSPMMDRTA